MEIITIIQWILWVISPFFAWKIASGITWKWNWMYKMRNKYPFLEKKPWGCHYCMVNWFCIIFLNIIFTSLIYINIGVSLFYCLIAYIQDKK